MVQIARRKKGRPSKADLAARRAAQSPETAEEQHDIRRSLRRRNVRYNIIDYDDDYVDEEDERRREKKKLKLMAKLNQGEDEEEGGEWEAREDHSPEEEQQNGGEFDVEEKHKETEAEDSVVKGRKVDLKGLHSVSVSGAPANTASGIPLPDQKTLELILDKLQKKDRYSVFAEPVDPEELPDYHDVIEHPMDFTTLRKKLANGSYSTLEQFESDVYLISSNAMQYNAPETVYYKQARSIQELAQKKFEKLRIDSECSQIELKSEQNMRPNSLVKKLVKKPLGCASQEPVGSDFSSGATLATIGDVQPIFHPMQHVSYGRSGNFDGIIEGNTFFIDANQEKAEDVLSGKGLLSKLGRKSFVLDDNRRASYNMSMQPITRSDSVFMSFESGMKQLVTVGLHAEYSYARSLARFSASLGPIAWKIASHRIQQVLPAGSKFGRGWVGEFEQLPTPNFVHHNDNDVRKETSLVAKLHSPAELPKCDKNCKSVESTIEHPVNGQMLEGKHPALGPTSGLAPGGNPVMFGSVGVRPNAPVNPLNQQQNVQSRNFGKFENNSLDKVELNSVPSINQNNSSLVTNFACNIPTANAPTEDSKPKEMVSGSMNALPSTPFKQPDANGVVRGELHNGKVTNSLNRQVTGPSSETISSQTGRATRFAVHGQDQGLSNPVQSMRMFTEKAQKQQTSNHSAVDTSPMTSSTPSGQRDDSSNASSEAARGWTSVAVGGFKQEPDHSSSPKNQISADSLKNQTREFHQHLSRNRGEFSSGGMSVQYDKNNFPFQAFVPQPIQPGAVSQFPNQQMVSPKLASADQTRFQMQSPWRGLSPRGQQAQQKQETLPPDLNIGCQSPGSPGKQSQQPDLALQL